ncbi:hydrogenase subunit MbhD domain-containing protein [Ectothiorhodospira shaposhnikovii]|uniref:hydrogenase subunit MbhD domain-containing protein n=1 Tax=Ectothiorhodospira shaposhnikovii TaxID=1054 RepID=UPI001908151C|nr:hydrogenase subunit MbhD domain-containing protein [Ectothiorhodospira shaposhnikovii]
MTGPGFIELGLIMWVLVAAIWIHVARATFAAAVGFIAFGLLLGLVWVRLGTVEVALTQAAVAIVTGVLLLSAAARMRASEEAAIPERPGPAMRSLIAVLCIVVSVAVALVMLLESPPRQPPSPLPAGMSAAQDAKRAER